MSTQLEYPELSITESKTLPHPGVLIFSKANVGGGFTQKNRNNKDLRGIVKINLKN